MLPPEPAVPTTFDDDDDQSLQLFDERTPREVVPVQTATLSASPPNSFFPNSFDNELPEIKPTF